MDSLTGHMLYNWKLPIEITESITERNSGTGLSEVLRLSNSITSATVGDLMGQIQPISKRMGKEASALIEIELFEQIVMDLEEYFGLFNISLDTQVKERLLNIGAPELANL